MQPSDTGVMLARCRKLALEAMLAAALPPPPPLPPLPRSAEDVAELPDDVAAAGLAPSVAVVLARVCRRLEAGPIAIGPHLRFAPVAPGGRGSH